MGNDGTWQEVQREFIIFDYNATEGHFALYDDDVTETFPHVLVTRRLRAHYITSARVDDLCGGGRYQMVQMGPFSTNHLAQLVLIEHR